MKQYGKKDGSVSKVSRVEGVNYIPETENPSFPAKSGCAPLTFLKEDGSPQQVYREPKSEIKCYYGFSIHSTVGNKRKKLSSRR